ncbi:RHS repeat-associated core domain-containing protein [Serratia marcescens]|uniref:RHS repeat-associated core domain-containing protein n=1 Tax=Serratia marcescens TaxID=615 RepID=UPI001EF11AC9|nr:RHS repeat-associated core domain-containing protein [Serratia marcescens]ULH09610.1 RHS repeat-associated core domain-containing protein [Serratia marcescens]
MTNQPEHLAASTLDSPLGFNGERTDPALGSYHLGNGYRMYNPTLRRFTAPDNMSPFGAGGINPYAYCEGDPINNTDPTGHSPLSTIFLLGMLMMPGGGAVDDVAEGEAAMERHFTQIREADEERMGSNRAGKRAHSGTGDDNIAVRRARRDSIASGQPGASTGLLQSAEISTTQAPALPPGEYRDYLDRLHAEAKTESRLAGLPRDEADSEAREIITQSELTTMDEYKPRLGPRGRPMLSQRDTVTSFFRSTGNHQVVRLQGKWWDLIIAPMAFGGRGNVLYAPPADWPFTQPLANTYYEHNYKVVRLGARSTLDFSYPKVCQDHLIVPGRPESGVFLIRPYAGV